MNINVLIESVIMVTTLVFLISITLLIYYSVKAKGLMEPAQLTSGGNHYVHTEHQDSIYNNRLRSENETIFDVALSEKADFTKYPEGQAILEAIKDFK